MRKIIILTFQILFAITLFAQEEKNNNQIKKDPKTAQTIKGNNNNQAGGNITINNYSITNTPPTPKKTSAKPKLKIIPFDTTKGSFNVLICPFQPLEKCSFKKTNIEKTIITRLQDLNEKDSLNLQVKYDTLDCVHTTEEANDIGKKLNADIVIWGDLYEHCSSDQNEACLKFVNISTGKKTETKIEKMASLSEVKEGKLQKNVDYIIYWVQGTRAVEQNNYIKALSLFKYLEYSNMDNYDLLNEIGICYFSLKEYNSSITYFNKYKTADW